jgi:hypothetical protein
LATFCRALQEGQAGRISKAVSIGRTVWMIPIKAVAEPAKFPTRIIINGTECASRVATSVDLLAWFCTTALGFVLPNLVEAFFYSHIATILIRATGYTR